jgi:hypothetical protein
MQPQSSYRQDQSQHDHLVLTAGIIVINGGHKNLAGLISHLPLDALVAPSMPANSGT